MMRELATREYAPWLAYAAAVLFLAQFLVASLLGEPLAAAGIHLLFVPVLVLLVMSTDSPPWARLSGYAWAGLAFLADLLLLGAAVFGGSFAPSVVLGTLALLPGAVWIAGASLADLGPARPLGIAASAAMAFGAILSLLGDLILVDPGAIVRVVTALTLALSIVWFAVLGRDLDAGKRHVGEHHPVRVGR
jgi:hypothetical protein